jgi:hypothetical protein
MAQNLDESGDNDTPFAIALNSSFLHPNPSFLVTILVMRPMIRSLAGAI